MDVRVGDAYVCFWGDKITRRTVVRVTAEAVISRSELVSGVRHGGDPPDWHATREEWGRWVRGMQANGIAMEVEHGQ